MLQIKNSITKHINIQNSVFNLNSGEVINGNFNNTITPPVIINTIEDKLNKALAENQIILVENQRIISELTDKFNLVEDIKLDIKELKDKLL